MKTKDMKKLIGTRIIAPVAGVGLLLAPAAASAELREVEQSIFGMDCAPCAVGVEKRIGGLEGVSEVALSLNEGKATVVFEPENRVTLKELRDEIRRNAFNPREARVEIAGRLAVEGGKRMLETEAGERFVLDQDDSTPEAWQALEQIESGQRALIKGTVPAGKEGPWGLSVTGSEIAG